MKIIVVGATGTIGKHVVKALEGAHEIVKVGSKSGDYQVDISNPESIEKFFEEIGPFDALVSAAGDAHFGPVSGMTDADFRKGIDSKLMGQINLVLIGQKYISAKGSFTLTSGVLSDDPIAYSTAVTAINGGLNSFVKGAAVSLENGIRINVVSPGLAEDSPHYYSFFPGFVPVSMSRIAQAYVKSILGVQTGQVYIVL